MDLSMWTIYSRLRAAGVNAEPRIKDGQPVLNALRFGESAGERAVCVRSGVTLSDGSVCRTVLSAGGDSLLLPDTEPSSAAELVFDVFAQYDSWEKRLLEAAVGGRSLQALLDIAYTAFERPMLIKNNSGWVFAFVGGDARLLDAREKGAKRLETIDELRAMSTNPEFNEMFRQRYPVVSPSPLYGCRVLRANVWQRDKRVCEIVALEDRAPFDPGETHLMHVFARVIEQYTKSNRSLYFTVSDVSGFLSGLLDGESFSAEGAAAMLRVTRWERDDTLAAVCIAAHDRIETPLLSALRDDLEDQFKNASVFIYMDAIVLLFNVSQAESAAALLASLKRSVDSEHFACGCSYEFSGLENFLPFYRQAKTAMDFALKERVPLVTTRALLPRLLGRQLGRDEWMKTLIDPDLLALKRYDEERGTEYLKTLREFLLCGGNYTDTAKRLGLHRNTLIYRISKLSELMTLDPHDPDGRENLLYSYLLL